MAGLISRAGVHLVYEQGGRGVSSTLLIHGWSCDRSCFAPQFEHLAARRTVATVDLRGHGDSGRPEPGPHVYDVETLADDVLALVDHAGMSAPVLVGHSLGALVALACADRGDGIAGVVMVDPAPITNEAAKQYFRNSVAACAADRDGSWRRRFANRLFLDTDVVRRAETIAAMSAGPPEIAAAVLEAMGQFDGAAALGRITVPVLSIGSVKPSNAAADLIGLCPAITIGQTVGAGHFNQLEVPDQVNPMIDRFLTIKHL